MINQVPSFFPLGTAQTPEPGRGLADEPTLQHSAVPGESPPMAAQVGSVLSAPGEQ